MWTAIGVGILVVAQAGALPATSRPQAAATAAPAKPAATVSSADTDGARAETPATATSGEATLRFRNEVGNAFQMTEARFALDGRPLPTLLTSAAQGQDYVIFAGSIPPGRHVITTHVTYLGQSRAAIFTYMKGYTFNLDSTHEINVPEGGTTNATIVGKTNKGFNVPFEQSLIVEMEPPAGLAGAR